MPEQLVITALGEDRPGIVDKLSQALSRRQLNIEDSRMSVLGGEFAVLLLVSGSAGSIDDFIASTTGLEKDLHMKLMVKPTSKPKEAQALIPYLVEVVAIDHPGIVQQIAGFFSARHINIMALDTDSYPAAHTGTPMFTLHMTIGVPAEQSIARLRDDFISRCDELNLDAQLTAAV